MVILIYSVLVSISFILSAPNEIALVFKLIPPIYIELILELRCFIIVAPFS